MGKLKIVTFNGVYKPGYKGGGPVKSIANIALALREDVELYIIASDRDYQDKKPYTNIKTNQWNFIDNEYVYYHENKSLGLSDFKKILSTIEYDIVYLNGYYSRYSRLYLLINKFKLLPEKPIILSPRGDFSEGEGNSFIKKLKKKLFVSIMKISNFNKGLTWHVTSEGEKQDLINSIGPNVDIFQAANISNPPINEPKFINKRSGYIDIVYVSRINRKKNILKAIKLLSSVKGKVRFNIYGPIFEADYWLECENEIKKLPSNITINYKGSIPSTEVKSVLESNHFLLFPTNGENYGHIIYESISVGCPVIISDKTPWKKLDKVNSGWDIDINNDYKFVSVLNDCVDLNQEDYDEMRKATNQYARFLFNNDKAVSQTRDMFQKKVIL